MAHRWLTPLLCLSVVFASAQSHSTVDSLVNRLSAAVGKEKVRLLSSLCTELSAHNTEKSIRYGKQAVQLAEKIHDEAGLAQASLALAHSYRLVNDRPHALSLLLNTLSIYRERKDLSGQALTLELLGQIYLDLGGYPEALDRLLQALELYRQAGKPAKAALVLGSIGHLYAAEHHDSSAIHYLRQSLALLEAQPQKSYGDLTLAANDIGLQYKATGHFDEALAYLHKAATYCQQIPLPYRTHAESMVLTNLGSLQESRHNYDKALEYNQQALALAQRSNNRVLLGLSHKNRGRIYSLQEDYPRAIASYLQADTIFSGFHMADQLAETSMALTDNYFHLGNYPMAVRYGKRALEISTKAHQPALAQKALQDLVHIFEATGDFRQALVFQQQYQAIRDTLLTQEKTDQISKLQVLFDVNRKQESIKLLEMTREKEKVIRYVLCAGILLLIIIGALIYRQQRMLIRKDRLIHASQQTLMQVQLTNTRMHEEQLRNELQGKNKELTTYALNFIQKNQLLEELKQKIRTLKQEADGKAGPELSRLQYMISHSFNLDKDWDDFRIYFEQVHHRFFQELQARFKDLTAKELRLCALMKLNLSSKEIATILGISVNSVKMARYRMRKKIGVNSETDLTCFMINFEKQLEEQSIR